MMKRALMEQVAMAQAGVPLTSRCIVVGLLALSCFAGVVQAAAQPDPHALLDRMDDAFANLSYDGVFTYFNGSDLASLRVVHKVVDGVQRERLVHLNGAPREIVRHGEDVSCIVMPGDDLIALEQSIPAGPFARAFVRQFDRISNTYAVGYYGEGRVAGRMAVRIAIQPKDEHRYGYRLWLDEATSLLLRSELVDQEGRQLEMFMFNQVRFGDQVRDEDLEAERGTGSMVNHLTLQPAHNAVPAASPPEQAPDQVNLAAKRWRTRWLPPGFGMASAEQREQPGSGSNVSSLMYSDGLATFSLFIEAMPRDGAADMVSRNGATVALTHALTNGAGDFLVTLVGEIPLVTARRIVDSVYLESR